MTYDAQYLGRNLNNRVQQTDQAFREAMMAAMAEATRHGALGSSRLYLVFWTEAKKVLERDIADALQFAYSLTGEYEGEVLGQVSYTAKRMVEVVMQAIKERGANLGGRADQFADVINKAEFDLTQQKDTLLDDFKHGMSGSGKLKKDSVISIVNNQTNSPGAIQQVGIGDKFSQSAVTQNQQPLADAIKRAIESEEFTKLTAEQQQAFKDVAQVVTEEIDKPAADAGKLKRWGERLVSLSKELGLHVAAHEIAGFLGKMFGG